MVIVILVAVFLKQLAWSTFVPLWQTPDEQAHFAQVQNLAETGREYIEESNNLSNEIHISEQIIGTDRDFAGNNKFTYHPEFKTPYSPDLEKTLADQPRSARTEYVKPEATAYPPLYYKLGSDVYRIFYFRDLLDRVFAVRFFSGLSLVGVTFLAFLIGKMIFSDEKTALWLAAMVGFQPMMTFVHAGVTSDALFNLVFAAFLYFCLRIIDGGLTLKNLICIGAVVAVAAVTKPQANIMLFIMAPLLLFCVSRKQLFMLVPVGLVLLFSARDLIWRLSVGAGFFPETEAKKVVLDASVWEHLGFTLRHTYFEVLPWFWGVFRWLSLGLPDTLRKITNLVTVASFFGFGWFLFQQVRQRKFSRQFWMIVFLAFSALVYFAAITAFDFGFRRVNGFSFGVQGRYFFPVLIPIMSILLIGLKPLGRLLAIGMVILNVIVFFWVIGSYYSFAPATFFSEAGQFKPEWLKFPVNLVTLGSYLICSLSLFPLIMKRK